MKKDHELKKSEETSEETKKTKKEKKHVKKSDKEKIIELADTLQHLQAEFENYKKRIDREKEEFVKFAHATVVKEFLPLLDSFEMALKNTNEAEKFVKGTEMIYAQFYSILEKIGLKPIKALGEKFDPYMHEVLMKEESDKEEGIVLEELQKGYLLNDKVLRSSKVKISQKVDDKKQ